MGVEVGAQRVVGTCLAVKKGERVLVLADARTQSIGAALFDAAVAAEAEAVLALVPPPKEPGEEPTDPLARMMADCDVVILATSQSMTHTAARRMANRAGARGASLPGVTEARRGGGARSPRAPSYPTPAAEPAGVVPRGGHATKAVGAPEGVHPMNRVERVARNFGKFG